MFEFKTKRYFGLDISESAIKLIEIYKMRDGYHLKTARLIELDIDPLFDDSEKRNAAIKKCLKQLFTEEEIDSGNAALSISGQSVFVRPLKVPKIAKNKIEQIIQYKAQHQVPFPINEVIWNYEIFETHDSPEIEVALVAVKRDIVEEKLKFLSETGVEVDFVEMDSFSLFNILDFVKSVKDKIILDIGAKITDIIIVEDRKIWTRSVLIGGNDLTKAIAADLKISFKEAENLKRKEGVIALTEKDRESSPYAAAISDAISPVLVELLTDVSKSMGYYKSQFGETKLFKEILITGGCSRLRNIAQFVRENIDIPTRVFNLLEKIKDDIEFNVSENLIGRMDIAVGLALRTVMPLSTKTNLLPKEILRAKEFERKKWYIFGSLIAGMFIFMTLMGFVDSSNKKKNASLVKASAMVGRYTKFHKEMTDLQKEIHDLEARLDSIVAVSEGRRRSIKIFTELIKFLPGDLWLTEISQDKDLLTLKGRTKGTFENINTFKNILVESGYFKDVKVESADVVKDKDITEDIRGFTIKIELEPLDGKLISEDHDV